MRAAVHLVLPHACAIESDPEIKKALLVEHLLNDRKALTIERGSSLVESLGFFGRVPIVALLFPQRAAQ